jgi:hypothetical protein
LGRIKTNKPEQVLKLLNIMKGNELLSACVTLLKGIERGDIIVYPSEETTFDYIKHLADTVEKEKTAV